MDGDLTQSPHDWSVATTRPGHRLRRLVGGLRPTRPAATPPTAWWRPTRTASPPPGSSWKARSPTAAGPGTPPRPRRVPRCCTTPVWPASPPERQPVRLRGGRAPQPTGPVIATSTSGPGGTWTTQTPSSLPGAMVTGIPLETAPATTTNWTTQVTAAQAIPQRRQPAQRALPPAQRLLDRRRRLPG